MRLIACLAMAASLVGGCDASPDETLPPVPVLFAQPTEIPFGDAVGRAMTGAANGLRDRLEPRWGPLTSRIYLLPADRRGDFARLVQAAMPAGWRRQDMDIDPAGTERLVFAKGNRLVAYMLLDRRAGASYPVLLLHNFP